MSKCGLTGFERKVALAVKEESAHNRRLKKLTGRQSWFKNRKPLPASHPQQQSLLGQKVSSRYKPKVPSATSQPEPQSQTQPSSVFFCPRTPGGILATRLREAEKSISSVVKQRVKIVEEGGTPIGGGIATKGRFCMRTGA